MKRALPRNLGHRRRGTALYITVMCVALIVSLLGLAGLTVVGVERRQSQSGSERMAASANVGSAVQLALNVINNDSNWRTTYTSGIETAPQSLGPEQRGTLSWILEDSDGSLTDADTDITLKGVGRVNSTVQLSSVRLAATTGDLTTLQCALYTVGGITTNHCNITGGPVSTAGTLSVEGDLIGDAEGNPIVYMPNPITGFPGTISGTATDPAPARGLPAPSAWNTYLSIATTIPFNSFPLNPVNPNERDAHDGLLSHLHNPWGDINADGVYYIQIPDGWTLSVDKGRVAATLLIDLGEGSQFKAGDKLLWDPPVTGNYPALIARGQGTGTVEIKGAGKLKEKDGGVNLNPPELPYLGVSNNHTNDQYDQKLTGLLHVIGGSTWFRFKSKVDFTGVAICEGSGEISSDVIISVDATIYNNPPMGYVPAPTFYYAVPASWRREAAP